MAVVVAVAADAAATTAALSFSVTVVVVVTREGGRGDGVADGWAIWLLVDHGGSELTDAATSDAETLLLLDTGGGGGVWCSSVVLEMLATRAIHEVGWPH